jgi:hypothetical protein
MTVSLILPRGARSLALSVAVLAFGSVFTGSRADAGANSPFLPHQALYELSLVKSRGGSIDSARGRILYTFTGNACEGYTSEFRQVSELQSGEDKVTLSDLRSTSWEDADGKSYRFKIDSRMNDTDSNPVDGVAERTGDHVTVKLKQPQAKTFTLDGSTVFPTQQIQRIIEAARAGKSVLELTVYDGSDNGEKVYNTLSVIGQAIPGDKVIAHDIKPTDGEQTPVYSMSFELYENGVSRSLMLDYNDFVVSGVLGKFDVKDSKPCK